MYLEFMNRRLDNSVLLSKTFNSFEELAHVVVDWDVDFKQMGCEEGTSSIFQAQVGSMLFSNAQFSCRVDQQGLTPQGMRTFAIFNKLPHQLNFYGHLVEKDCLLLFPSHGEIQSFSQPGFDVLTFSFPEAMLEDSFSANEAGVCNKNLTSEESLFPLLPFQAERFRMLIHNAASLVLEQASSVHESVIASVQEEILSLLLEVLSGPRPCPAILGPVRHRKMMDVLEYIETNAHRPILVSELSEIGRTSVRTIQSLFQGQLGISPKAFINARRLSGAHRDLWRAEADGIQVTDIANRWGFWHMGQFASDYRKQFGELPSHTLSL